MSRKISRQNLEKLRQISFQIAILNGLSMLDAKHFGVFMGQIAKSDKISQFQTHLQDFIRLKFRLVRARPRDAAEQ